MTVLIYVVAAVLACRASAEVVDLSCGDNATCIEGLTRQLVRGIRSQKPVRLFGMVLIEPLLQREARSNQGALARFLNTHALSFDWEDYSFRFSKPASRSGVLEMEVFSGRAVEEAEADEPTVTKKGSEEKEEAKPKRRIIRRRQKKRILQALLPMILGMKSAGTVLLAIAAVAALTMKAFVASKLALLVTVGMAAKRLYESFGQGDPTTSNVLWSIARYFRFLFGLPEAPPMMMPGPYMMGPMGQPLFMNGQMPMNNQVQ